MTPTIITTQSGYTLSPQQSAVVSWVLQGTGSLNLIARAGTGKCLDGNVLVMKFDGSIVKAKDIKTGDQLMGPDSQPRNVLRTNHGAGEMYKITPIKGNPWICNGVHMMTLVGSNHHSGEIIDVELSGFLSTQKTKRADKEWKLFRVPVSFPSVEVTYDPYVIASWVGDGTTIYPQWTLGFGKAEILNYLQDAAVTCGCIAKVSDGGSNCWSLRYSIQERGAKGPRKSHDFAAFLRDQCVSNGEKVLPREYVYNDTATRKTVLAALLDTDGHQSSPSTFDFITKSKMLCEQVLFIARSLGLAAYSSPKFVRLEGWDTPREYQRISISGDFSTFQFLRHTANPRGQIKNVLRTGWDAEPIGPGDYYGFTLDGDGRFLLGDFTVTHNTFTIERLCEAIPMNHQVFVGAFNKAIADELAKRILYSNCKCGTFHSLGFSLLRRVLGNVKIGSPDTRKVPGLARVQFKYDRKNAEALAKVVSFGKQEGFGIPGVPIDDKELWTKIIDHHDMWDDFQEVSPDRIINLAIQVSKQSLELCRDGHIDFDDMLLAPLAFSDKHYGLYDWVLVDEAQDMNEVRRRLVHHVLKPGGRVVAVGDDKQAIYGFSGASNDSLELMKSRFNSAELPLTVTRRCPKAVVKVAQEWVPDFTAHEDAPDGQVQTIGTSNVSWLWDGQTKWDPANDVILCRNTRPLIGISERLRESGIPCMVEGPNGQHLIKLATKWGEDVTVANWRDKVDSYQESEIAKLERRGGQEDRIERLVEKCDTVRDFARTTVEKSGKGPAGVTMLKVAQRIEQMFDYRPKPGQDVLRLCTIHRAKGREWNRVVLVGRNRYMPSPFAKQVWQMEQEINLMYVATTRAKRELVDVDVPQAKKHDDGVTEWWEREYDMLGRGGARSYDQEWCPEEEQA